MPSMRSPVSAQPTPATARREAISTTLGTVADSIEAAGSAGRLVLVVSTQPEGPIAALIATHRRPVEQAVVGHHRLETARGGDIGPVDRPVRERVHAQPRSLRDVAGDVGPGGLRVLLHGRGNLALEEGAQLLLGVGESQVAIEVGAAGRGPL